jgi:hypothetical protein
MKLLRIEKAPYPHKYTAVFDDGTKTNFGYQPMQDFTQHGDIERRRLYRLRHKHDLETGNPKRAGFLSYYILWGKNTDIDKNIVDYKRRFNL